MSAEVAKSSPGNVAGRRTPLSLNQKTDTKANKAHISGIEKDVTNGSTSQKSEMTQNIESKKDKKSEIADSGELKQVNVEEKKKETAQSNKKEEKKQENGTDAKHDSKTNGHKVEKDVKLVSDAENNSSDAESIKSKASKDEKHSKKDKDNEEKATEKLSKKEERQREKKSKKDKANEDKQIDVEASSKGSAKQDEAIEPVVTGRTRESRKAAAAATQSSTKNEPEIIAIDEDDMECLIVETEPEPEPEHEMIESKQSTPGKVLRHKNRPAPYIPKTNTQTSPEKPLIRKFTTSSGSPNKNELEHSGHVTPSTDQNFRASLRSISGRKSFRPLPEISTYRSFNRESYRKINTELDVSASSLNVTVGSEIPNDSMFSFFNRSRKRERTPTDTPDAEQDVEISPKSPKRARLEFVGGILDIVKSPITLLRSRFSRTTLQSSTPNGKMLKEDNDGVENVSVFEANETEYPHEAMTVDEAESVKEDELNEKLETINNIDEEDDLKIKEKLIDAEPIEPSTEAVTNVNKRSICAIM